MALGATFLGVKVIEYTEKFEKREVPGANFCFNPQGAPCKGVSHEEEKTPDLIQRYLNGRFGKLPGLDKAAEHGAEATTHAEAGEAAAPEPGVPGEATERQRSMPGSEVYFSLYFAMTGMHALHMIVGIGLMVWLLYWATKGLYSAEYYTPIENFGLYWHFVDIVWIFLFPLLYLINRHIGGHH
ncbi:MAG: cytochrome c oxidase subunit 3 [Acidobacteriales bacterium]|nr:cytochrome c oxidase subunit 3 [Terriglobales bacterium]